MRHWPSLRASEWLFIVFFSYIALLSHWFPARPNLHQQPLLILLCVATGLGVLASLGLRFLGRVISFIRDFLPIALTLLAFREMEYFLPRNFDTHLEFVWVGWDRVVLGAWHVRSLIEKTGWVIPSYLELSYLLVYGLPFYCIVMLYLRDRRAEVDRFFVVYLTGTLLAYGLFPFFPTQPPRLAFPGIEAPDIHTLFRTINLAILHKATIHVGVFPSAHVSSAFAAAWAMFSIFNGNKRFGWALTIYAASVSVATIYGRYHYTADVVAGIVVSLIAAAVAFGVGRPRTSSGLSSFEKAHSELPQSIS